MGKSTSTPAPPDPKETAAAQTSTNVATALANAALKNVNQVTPYGSLTYTQTGRQFIADPNGQTYYVSPSGEYSTSRPASPAASGGGGGSSDSGMHPFIGPNAQPLSQEAFINANGGGGGGSSGGGGGLPAGYSTATGYYIPTFTATQTLSPEEQAIFNQTEAAKGNLASIANSQSAFLKDYLPKGVDTSGLPALQGSLNTSGAPSLQGSLDFSNLPALQSTINANGPALVGSLDTAGVGNVQQALNLSNLPGLQSSVGNTGDITKSYDIGSPDKVFDALMARLNPQLANERSALETRLANQGLAPGSKAYNDAIDAATRQENDARIDAILNATQQQATLAGINAQQAAFQNAAQQQGFNQAAQNASLANSARQQAFNEALQGGTFANAAQQQAYNQALQSGTFQNAANEQAFSQAQAQANLANSARAQGAQEVVQGGAFQNQARQQAINEALSQAQLANSARAQGLQEAFAVRNQPLNEISALLSGSQVTQPNFVNANEPTIPTVDYAGLVEQNYKDQVAAANAQNAQAQSILGGLFGLGSSFLMGPAAGLLKSDRRVKTDIRRVGTLDNGLPVYLFRYTFGGPMQIGVMAQDVEQVKPEAVREFGGVKHVDYAQAVEAL